MDPIEILMQALQAEYGAAGSAAAGPAAMPTAAPAQTPQFMLPPAVEPEPVRPLPAILAILGDAMNASARGLGAPVAPTNAMDKLRARREQRASEATRLNTQQALIQHGDKRYADTEARRKGERAEDQRLGLEAEERGATRRADEISASQDFKREMFEANKRWDTEMFEMQRNDPRASAAIEKLVLDGAGDIGEFASMIDVVLAGGNPDLQIPGETPDQIRVRFYTKMKGYPKMAREKLEIIFKEVVEPKLDEYERSQQEASLRDALGSMDLTPKPEPGNASPTPLELMLRAKQF